MTKASEVTKAKANIQKFREEFGNLILEIGSVDLTAHELQELKAMSRTMYRLVIQRLERPTC